MPKTLPAVDFYISVSNITWAILCIISMSMYGSGNRCGEFEGRAWGEVINGLVGQWIGLIGVVVFPSTRINAGNKIAWRKIGNGSHREDFSSIRVHHYCRSSTNTS